MQEHMNKNIRAGLRKEKKKKKHIHKRKNKERRDLLNLKSSEIKAPKYLKYKIKEGKIIVSQTDKSSRFAVLSRKRYMKSGMVHASKDKKI